MQSVFLATPTPPRLAGAYSPSPLFSRLHDLARLSFFPSLVHSSLPPFLLSHLHFPNYYLSFANPIVVMSLHSACIFLSHFAIRSTLPDASRHSRAVLLAAPTFSPFNPQIEWRESFPVLFRFWTLLLTLLHRSGTDNEKDELHTQKQVWTS